MPDEKQKKKEDIKTNDKKNKGFLFFEIFFFIGFAILIFLIFFGEQSPTILHEDDLDKFLNTEDIKNVTVRFKNNIANIEGLAVGKDKKEYNFEVNVDIHRFNKSFEANGVKHESYHECFKTAVEKAKKKYGIKLENDYTKKNKQFFFSINSQQKTSNPVLVFFEMMLGLFLQVLIHILIYFAIFSFGFYFLKKIIKKSGGVLPSQHLFGERTQIINQAENQRKVTFKDIAGYDVIKKEISILVTYLKNPEKFKKMGAKIPRGFLLYGPPGTGKTLLVKALAGEAGVPVYCVSMSEIYSPYIAVAAQTIRNIFYMASKNAPSIIIIDEIDMVGQKDNRHYAGNEVINQLLGEMDGLRENNDVIVFGTTNCMTMIEKALLRSGRFDRHIEFYLPTRKDREKIFEYVCRNKPVDKNINFQTLSRITSGLSGADITNIINTAAIMTVEQNKNIITFEKIEEAIEKIFAGLSYLEVSEQETKKTAIHESGHAIIALMLTDKIVEKISITPRGRAGGYTWLSTKEEMSLPTKQDLLDNIAISLAGRESEKLFFSQESSGAYSDLQEATSIAYSMVRELGMSSKLAPAHYQQKNVFSNNYPSTSEQTDYLIDQEVFDIIKQQETKVKQILTKHKKTIKKLSDSLIENKILYYDAVMKIVFGDDYLQNSSKEEKTSKSISENKKEEKIEEKIEEKEKI